MTRLTCRILPLALLSACVGLDDTRPRGLDTDQLEITGGSPETGYPAVFAVAYNGQGGCSGTCITADVGITAAHCVEGEPASVLSALFGDDEFQPTMTLPVSEVAVEPSGADLALLRFDGTCPATIPYNPIPLEGHVGEPVVMVGFGVTVESANDAGVKRSGTATLFSATPSEVPGMEAGELATSNDPAGTCDGDSGGPTFMTFDGVEYMVGVTSRGSVDENGEPEPCGLGRSIAVRADSYAGFIDDFIGAADPGGMDPGGDDPDGSDPDDGDDDLPPGEGGDEGQGRVTQGGCQAAGSSAGTGAPLFLLVLAGLLRRRRRRL